MRCDAVLAGGDDCCTASGQVLGMLLVEYAPLCMHAAIVAASSRKRDRHQDDAGLGAACQSCAQLPFPSHRLQVAPVHVPLEMAGCQRGQVATSQGCGTCAAGTFVLAANDSSCHACSSRNSNCSGMQLVPLPGFWHSGPRSAQVHSCPLVEGCRRPEAQQAALLAHQQAGITAGYDGGEPHCSMLPGLVYMQCWLGMHC